MEGLWVKSIFNGSMRLGQGSPGPQGLAGHCGQGRTRLMAFLVLARPVWRKTWLRRDPVPPCVMGKRFGGAQQGAQHPAHGDEELEMAGVAA